MTHPPPRHSAHPAFRGLMIAASVALLCLAVAVFMRPAAERPSVGEVGVAFTLTDHNSKPFSSDALQGHYNLIFFGFTLCPDICPTELQRITDALRLADLPKGALTPVLITIDPARDTPTVLKAYLANFHPDFIGLTGTEAQIDAVIAGYKVYAAKVDHPDYSDYMMDHSSFIYLIGPDGELLKLFSKTDTPAMMADALKTLVTSRD
ncbi:MAG: SCO family protein [Pseudomonadota bacterium]